MKEAEQQAGSAGEKVKEEAEVRARKEAEKVELERMGTEAKAAGWLSNILKGLRKHV